MDLNQAKDLNKRLVYPAQNQFPGSALVATGGKGTGQYIIDARNPPTFEQWFSQLRKRLSDLMWPDGPVTCLSCDGIGCNQCGRTGRVPLSSSPIEESKIELAVRLLLNAMPHCPSHHLGFAEQALDLMCKRWSIVRNKPPF